MPKPFTPAEKHVIRERLLAAGARLFSVHGLKKTSVEELAAAAGISKAAFYLFFASKEAFFMDVVERAEAHFRQQVLETLDRPGPTPRARLAAALQHAFRLWRTIPVLQFFTQRDYAALVARVPAEQIAEHVASDQAFLHTLIARAQAAGIPIQVTPTDLGRLLYVLFFASLHADDLGPGRLTPAIDQLAELVAAYCLGELALGAEDPNHAPRH